MLDGGNSRDHPNLDFESIFHDDGVHGSSIWTSFFDSNAALVGVDSFGFAFVFVGGAGCTTYERQVSGSRGHSAGGAISASIDTHPGSWSGYDDERRDAFVCDDIFAGGVVFVYAGGHGGISSFHV